jgi:hypothetical protein
VTTHSKRRRGFLLLHPRGRPHTHKRRRTCYRGTVKPEISQLPHKERPLAFRDSDHIGTRNDLAFAAPWLVGTLPASLTPSRSPTRGSGPSATSSLWGTFTSLSVLVGAPCPPGLPRVTQVTAPPGAVVFFCPSRTPESERLSGAVALPTIERKNQWLWKKPQTRSTSSQPVRTTFADQWSLLLIRDQKMYLRHPPPPLQGLLGILWRSSAAARNRTTTKRGMLSNKGSESNESSPFNEMNIEIRR